MNPSFERHTKLAANAQSHLTHAVSLDEQKKTAEAALAYQRSIHLLNQYLAAFSSTASSFATLAAAEQHLVAPQAAQFVKYLAHARDRHTVLVNTIRMAKANHAVAVPSPHTSVIRRPSPAVARSVLPRPGTAPAPSHNGRLQNVVARRPAPAPAPTAAAAPDPLRKLIEGEIVDASPNVPWDDVYGLDNVKAALHEMVILPAQRPDLYHGLRAPGRGVLLFGPPGTGKTLIAKAVATSASATFFSISASTLLSKWHGESERLVRMLFTVARERQPAFIFIDEADAILGSRSDNEHEASRRLKTEFMAQFDGATPGASADERVYVMAASNRPQDLDDAVRRRLDRRIYVSLPDSAGRTAFLQRLMARGDGVTWRMTDEDVNRIARLTDGFSGSDLKALCREASLMPLRQLGQRVSEVAVEDVRACNVHDFEEALRIVRRSSDARVVMELEKWNEEFGSIGKKTAKTTDAQTVRLRGAGAARGGAADAGRRSNDPTSGKKSGAPGEAPIRRITRSLAGAMKGSTPGRTRGAKR